jgi:hypothetical protein
MTTVRQTIPPRILAMLLALAPGAALAVEPAIHAEATLGFDTNPLREAGGEQGLYPFIGAIVDAGLAHGGEKTRLRAAFTEGARLHPTAPDADLLATRVDLAGAWASGDQGEVGATLAFRDISERGGVRSETAGSFRLDTRVRLSRFDVASGAGLSALYPRTSRLEPFASIGPDAGIELGFAPAARQRVRVGWELRVRNHPRWDTERWDWANGLVLDWSRRGSPIIGGGVELTWNQSTVPRGAYFRNRLWARAAGELPWDVTLAAQGSLQWSNYPGGLALDGEQLIAENDERENALELRFSRPLGRDFEAVMKLAAYHGEFSRGDGGERSGYWREVVQLSIGWRPE